MAPCSAESLLRTNCPFSHWAPRSGSRGTGREYFSCTLLFLSDLNIGSFRKLPEPGVVFQSFSSEEEECRRVILTFLRFLSLPSVRADGPQSYILQGSLLPNAGSFAAHLSRRELLGSRRAWLRSRAVLTQHIHSQPRLPTCSLGETAGGDTCLQYTWKRNPTREKCLWKLS